MANMRPWMWLRHSLYVISYAPNGFSIIDFTPHLTKFRESCSVWSLSKSKSTLLGWRAAATLSLHLGAVPSDRLVFPALVAAMPCTPWTQLSRHIRLFTPINPTPLLHLAKGMISLKTPSIEQLLWWRNCRIPISYFGLRTRVTVYYDEPTAC